MYISHIQINPFTQVKLHRRNDSWKETCPREQTSFVLCFVFPKELMWFSLENLSMHVNKWEKIWKKRGQLHNLVLALFITPDRPQFFYATSLAHYGTNAGYKGQWKFSYLLSTQAPNFSFIFLQLNRFGIMSLAITEIVTGEGKD